MNCISFKEGSTVVCQLILIIALLALPISSSIAEDNLDSATYDGVQQLRNKLCLTTRDLAAMGCTKAETETILKDLLAWYNSNKVSIASSEKAVIDAEKALKAAFKKINMGPKDKALIAKVPDLKSAVVTSKSNRDKVYAQAAISIEASIPSDKRVVWKTAQYNSGNPERYRYVPALSCKQVLDLKTLLRKKAFKDEPKILTSAQLQAKNIAAVNVAQKLSVIEEGEVVALPMPPEAKEDPAK